MSAKFMKRPSSAKRHIKYKNFSQFVSASRLRRVQNLLDVGDKGTAVDAILLVSGIDGRYNEGCTELINYLLFGFFDVRKKELEKSGFAEEVIDDLVMVIRKTRVDVYCNPINWHYFLPYISHWTNISFHCLQEEEYDLESDEGAELSEEFKVHSLITMTRGCQRIGVPFFGSTTSPADQKFDKMLLEKWPVIQAFALEDFGGGGFFTLKYEAVDISAAAHQLYSMHDPVTIEILTTENLPMLERQWKTMIDCVSMEISKNEGVLTQDRIAEPLRSFYQHGRVGVNHKQKSGRYKLPFVLFGKNTSKATLQAVQEGASPPSCELKLDMISTVSHMVCQVMSPRSPVTCSRTYFISNLLNAVEVVGDGDNAQAPTSGDSALTKEQEELRYLVTLYQSMVDAVISGIQVYTVTASLSQARAKVTEELNEGCNSIMNSTLSAYLSDKSKVMFSVEAIHKNGNVEEVQDGQRTHMMKVASVWMYDVPPCSTKGPSPGSLIFSECFLDSALTVTSGVQTSVDSDILYLTSHIPRHQQWGVGTGIRAQHQMIRGQLEKQATCTLGTLLMAGDKVEVTAGSELTLPPEPVQLYAYKNGLAFYSEAYGSFALSGSDCLNVHLFDGDSMTTAVLLIITYHTWSAVKLPPHLHSPDNMLFVVFGPRSKAHTHLYGQALISWKEDSNMPPVSRISAEELPEQLDSLHQYLQQVNQHEGLHSLVTAPQSTSLQDASHNLPHLPDYLKHMTVSCAIPNAISRSDLSPLLERDPEFAVEYDIEQVVVTVLTGIPGSEKQTLCSNLSKLQTNTIRWVVVRQMEESVLDAGQLHRMLASAVNSHLQQPDNKKETRVLLVAPGFVNTPDVIGTVVKHPDPKIRRSLKIGAVTTCIDPMNTFMQNRMLLPMVLNQCAQGWVNNIIFTSQTKAPSKLLDQIQAVVRSVNTDVSLMLAESGEIKRSTDLDQVLSDSLFEMPAMVRARLLLYPAWKLQTKNPPLKGALNFNDVILKFSQPLERTKLMLKLKAIYSSLAKFPFEGNIYHIYGLVCFADSKNTVDVQFTTLSQSLVMHVVGSQAQPVIRGQHQYYLVFTGCCLSEPVLKDWLRGCAKQKPEKKKILTKGDLTKADMKKIHNDYHLEPLPSGWFYNGSSYVSMAGEKTETHPCMEEFIEDYLMKKNEEIDKYNAVIDKEKFTDLFP